MIDKCVHYGYLWQYSFNASKSAVMVRGESHCLWAVSRRNRSWLLGSVVIDEVDVFRHLGITISVSGSVLPHTTRSISSARSAFYALHAVGPRYGCLHPLTSLKLYFTYSCSILHFDLDVLSPTKSELLMLERCQLSILKSILGLVHSSFIGYHFIVVVSSVSSKSTSFVSLAYN